MFLACLKTVLLSWYHQNVSLQGALSLERGEDGEAYLPENAGNQLEGQVWRKVGICNVFA